MSFLFSYHLPARRLGVIFVLVAFLCSGALSCGPTKSQSAPAAPKVEDYATVETVTNGVPVWSLSNLCYIYGVSPDLMPGLVMQEGNQHPVRKFQPRKSWEIKHNLVGSTFEMGEPRTSYNDSEPFLPIHLIDGNSNTIWSSFEWLVPDARPEWIRIDLPTEIQVASVALICAKDFRYGDYGKALPKELEVRTSRDAWHWESVYTNKNVAVDQPQVEIKFKARPAKQIWIIGNRFPKSPPTQFQGGKRHMFSIGEVEVRDRGGNNLVLFSRGAGVSVSSTSYALANDRFSANALWGPLQYDLGNTWVRVGVDNGLYMWHYVEHEKGKLEVDPRADEAITECVRHGIHVIMGLDFKGNWIYLNPPRKTNWLEARYREMNDSYDDPPGPANANPEMYQAYLRYIEYVVRHFKDRVTYFEIANEWNGMSAEQYVNTWFEPIYKVVKQVAPGAKVMLGNVGGFDRNAILDCLGWQRKTGVQNGKFWLDAGAVTPAEGQLAGALAVREDVQAKDNTVSVETDNKGEPGIVLRYKDPRNYLAALYAARKPSIMFYDVVKGDWGKPLAKKQTPDFGSNVKLGAKVQGSAVTLTVSGDGKSTSTTYTLQRLNDSGIGVLNRMPAKGIKSCG